MSRFAEAFHLDILLKQVVKKYTPVIILLACATSSTDRVPDYESVGWEFESPVTHQKDRLCRSFTLQKNKIPCRGAEHFVSKGVLGLEIYEVIRGINLMKILPKKSIKNNNKAEKTLKFVCFLGFSCS